MGTRACIRLYNGGRKTPVFTFHRQLDGGPDSCGVELKELVDKLTLLIPERVVFPDVYDFANALCRESYRTDGTQKYELTDGPSVLHAYIYHITFDDDKEPVVKCYEPINGRDKREVEIPEPETAEIKVA